MNTNRKTAVIVGALFILGTVTGILSVVFSGPVLNSPATLPNVSANENRLILGALMVLVMGFALALVPVMMFPILKRQNESLALGYVVFRGGLETVTYIITATSMLLLIPLSRAIGNAGAAGTDGIQTAANLLTAITRMPMTIFVFSLGALIFYSLLFQSNLIPRWLSMWGLAAIGLHLAAGFLAVFSMQDGLSGWANAMHFPIFLQEMVMAGWLIVKGFKPSLPARAAN